MRLAKMTIHALKMEWYFWLYRFSKWSNKKYGDKFYYHAERLKNM